MVKSYQKYLILGVGLAVLALCFSTLPALAQSGNPYVTEAGDRLNFNWGGLAAEIIVSLGVVASGLVGLIKGYLPGPVRWGVEVMKLDQVATRAIQTAAFDFADRIQNEGFSVQVKNDLLRQALVVASANAKGIVDKYKTTFELKLKARLQEYIESKVG